MNDNRTLADLQNKVFHMAATTIRTGVEQLNLETWWTDRVQKLIDYGNKNYLRNYSLRLEIEGNEDDIESLGGN